MKYSRGQKCRTTSSNSDYNNILLIVLRLMSVPVSFKSSADGIFLDELVVDRTAIFRMAWSSLGVGFGSLGYQVFGWWSTGKSLYSEI